MDRYIYITPTLMIDREELVLKERAVTTSGETEFKLCHIPSLQLRILNYLALTFKKDQYKVVTRLELHYHLYGESNQLQRNIDVHVRRIRISLGHNIIETIHNQGYIAGPAMRAGLRMQEKLRLRQER